MKGNPVRTVSDYRRALDQITRVWDARPGTQEHDELESLGTLVDAYESAHAPIEPPDPTEALRFRVQQQAAPCRDD